METHGLIEIHDELDKLEKHKKKLDKYLCYMIPKRGCDKVTLFLGGKKYDNIHQLYGDIYEISKKISMCKIQKYNMTKLDVISKMLCNSIDVILFNRLYIEDLKNFISTKAFIITSMTLSTKSNSSNPFLDRSEYEIMTVRHKIFYDLSDEINSSDIIERDGVYEKILTMSESECIRRLFIEKSLIDFSQLNNPHDEYKYNWYMKDNIIHHSIIVDCIICVSKELIK